MKENMKEELLNKIHQIDCLQFMRSLPDKCIDLVVTDPPYGMEFQSGYRKEKYEKIENDSNLNWLPEFIKQTARTLKDESHAYFFCSFHNVDIFKQEIQKHLPVKNILIWVKNNTGMGDLFGDYAPQYEMCIFAGGGRRLNDGRSSNVMKFNRTGNNFHPTEKPVDLMSFLIKKSSSENEIVFDAFSGSGSTLVSAKQLGRKFLGCELSKKYVAIANERLKQDYLF